MITFRDPEVQRTHDEFLESARRMQEAIGKAKTNESNRFHILKKAANPFASTLIRRPGSKVSPYRGVTWNIRDSLWVARIKYQGRSKFLGVYGPDHAIEAAKAYDRAAWYYFGQSAKLNFPRSRSSKWPTIYIPPLEVPKVVETRTMACTRCRQILTLDQFYRRWDGHIPEQGVYKLRQPCRKCMLAPRSMGCLEAEELREFLSANR